LVEAKWEAIEAAQHADTQARLDKLQRDTGHAAAPLAAISAVSAVGDPGIAITGLAGVAAGAPLLPSAADRARAARRRDDEEALLLLLVDL
jgi:hypothetical protein